MKRRDGRSIAHSGREPVDPFPHLASSFVCKRQSQDLLRAVPILLRKVHDLSPDCFRLCVCGKSGVMDVWGLWRGRSEAYFSGASARDDDHSRVRSRHGLELSFIEFLHERMGRVWESEWRGWEWRRKRVGFGWVLVFW